MNKSLLTFISFFSIISLFYQCKPREEILSNDIAQLQFSEDTVMFDTLFSTVGSITKRLTVTNPLSNAIEIDFINLENGNQSNYELTVQGITSFSNSDILLRGGDSLLILVTVNIDPSNQNLPFFVEDKINFIQKGQTQNVLLSAWGQDGFFITDSVLPCSERWSGTRPYIVTRDLKIDSTCTLTIDPGVRVHFNRDVTFKIYGTLNAKGTFNNPIRFEGSRLEEDFKDISSQWKGVVFESNMVDLDWCIFKHAERALIIEKNLTAKIQHTKFLHHQYAGIIQELGNLEVSNSLFANIGGHAISSHANENVKLYHNTVGNFNETTFRSDSSVFISEMSFDKKENKSIKVDIRNNILWGSRSEELRFDTGSAASTSLNLQYNLLKTRNNGVKADTTNIIRIRGALFTDFEDEDYNLDSLSEAVDRGVFLLDASTQRDLNGENRDSQPDIGAYEFK